MMEGVCDGFLVGLCAFGNNDAPPGTVERNPPDGSVGPSPPGRPPTGLTDRRAARRPPPWNPVNRLLFIEDDDEIRLAIRLALEDEGYQVDEARDGRTGLALFDRHEPDLVLLDLRLPDMVGFDVCRSIRTAASCRS